MKKWRTIPASVAGMALVIGLAGCGPASSTQGIPSPPGGSQTPHSSAASTPRPTRTVSTPSSSVVAGDFPRLIGQAMNKTRVVSGLPLLALTMLPNNELTGETVKRTRMAVVLGPIPSYRVDLLTGRGVELAEFGGVRYPNVAAAAAASMVNPAYPAARPTPWRSVKIGRLRVLEERLPGADRASVVSWSMHQWKVAVGQRGTRTVSVSQTVLNEVASDVSDAVLPETASRGLIAVDIRPGSQVVVAISWQTQRDVYQVQVFTPAAYPVQTALQLAGSMERYPLKGHGTLGAN